MSRLLSQAISTLTMISYVLTITWGPLWHDHRHCHSHNAAECCPEAVVEHSHPHCCSHHHHTACTVESSATVSHSSSTPCHSPLHDDDCPVCQVLAHPPLAAPQVVVVDASVPVQAFVSPAVPLAERLTPAAYDSRGPPSV